MTLHKLNPATTKTPMTNPIEDDVEIEGGGKYALVWLGPNAEIRGGEAVPLD